GRARAAHARRYVPPSSSSSTQLGALDGPPRHTVPTLSRAKPDEQLDDRGRPPDIPPRAPPRRRDPDDGPPASAHQTPAAPRPTALGPAGWEEIPTTAVCLPVRARPSSHGTGRGERHTARARSRPLAGQDIPPEPEAGLHLEPHEHD